LHSVPQHRRILGETIRAYRRKAKLSQEAMAEKADLSPVYISRVECGKENISVDAAIRIAKAVGIRLHELFRGT